MGEDFENGRSLGRNGEEWGGMGRNGNGEEWGGNGEEWTCPPTSCKWGRIMKSSMSDRTFTLDEAQSLLPVLESLLRTAIAGKELFEEVESEMQAVINTIFLTYAHLYIILTLP